MAHLLDLVDQLIGDVLRGNVFTDLDPFVNSVVGSTREFARPETPVPGVGGPPHVSPFEPSNLSKPPLQSPNPVSIPPSARDALARPPGADNHNPNADPRLLNFPQGTPHPHADSKVIPANQVHGPPGKAPDLASTTIQKQTTTAAGVDYAAEKQSRVLELAQFHNEITKQVGNVEASARTATSQPNVPKQGGGTQVFSEFNRPGPAIEDGGGFARNDVANTFHPDRLGPNARGDVPVNQAVATQHGRIENNPQGGSGYTAVQGPGGTILRHVDIIASTKWLATLATDAGIPIPVNGNAENIFKGITWNISNLLLASFNPTDVAGHGPLNALWNPLSLALSALPLLRLTSPTNITVGAATEDIGVAVGGGYQKRVLDSVAQGDSPIVGERLLQMRKGQYVKSLDGNQVSQVRGPDAGFKGDLAAVAYGGHPSIQAESSNSLLGAAIGAIGSLLGDPSPAAAVASIEEQVDSDAVKKKGLHGNIYTSENPYNALNAYVPLRDLEEFASENPDLHPAVEKLSQLFKPTVFPGGAASTFNQDSLSRSPSIPTVYNFLAQTDPADLTSPTENADAPGLDYGIVDATFTGEKPVDGSNPPISEGIVVDEPLNDDNLYMPFMFQDLRDSPATFLYFRAFLRPGMNENFQPEWNEERFYGRVDRVPIYVGTTRTINLSFDIAAFKPSDLPLIYRKLEKLQSMVYPTYDTRGFMKAGPIVRMRVGDLFATDVEAGAGRGLPGFINALDFSFDDSVWNTTTDFKVPRLITVSLGFTVVHNGNPGTYPHESYAVLPDGTVEASVGETTFGVGKFTPDGEATTISVSRAEMRRIFKTIRG